MQRIIEVTVKPKQKLKIKIANGSIVYISPFLYYASIIS